MEMVKAPNLNLLSKAHVNRWVAFSLDKTRLLAVADSLQLLREKIGENAGIVMRVLPIDVGYAPNARS